MEERWYIIPKYPKYEINDAFEVRDRVQKRIKKYYTDENGYFRTNISAGNGKWVKPGMHQLVALTFIPNPDNKPEVNHIDGDKKNNAIANLEWATQAENKAHAKANLLVAHKLKPKDVIFIRQSYGEKTIEELESMFGVTRSTLLGIITGRTRKDIGGPIIKFHPFKKIVNLKTGQIFESVQEVAKLTGKTVRSLQRSLCGERYNKTDFRYVGQETILKEQPPKYLSKTPTFVYDMAGVQLGEFSYIQDAAKQNNVEVADIKKFMSGKCQHVKGLKFKFIDPEKGIIEPLPFISKKKPLNPKKTKQPITPGKTVIKYDSYGNIFGSFASINAAAKAEGVDKSYIKKLIKGVRRSRKGFHFKFA